MRYFLLLFFIVLLTGCKQYKKQTEDLYNYIPQNSSLILDLKKQSTFSNTLKKDTLLKRGLDYIDSLNINLDILIAFENNLDSDFSILGKVNDSILKKTPKNLHLNIKDSIFILTSLKKNADYFKKNHSKNVYKSIKNDLANFALLTKNRSSYRFFNTVTKPSTNLFTGNFFFNFELTQDKVMLNGIYNTNDSTRNFNNVFKNTRPQQNQLHQIVPLKNSGFKSVTFDDYYTFIENLIAFKNNKTNVPDSVFEYVNEVGTIDIDNVKAAIAIKSIDPTLTFEALKTFQTSHSTYKNTKIYTLENDSLFRNTFKPVITFEQSNYYARLNDFFVFSDKESTIKTIISSYLNNKVLIYSTAYLERLKLLNDESSLLLVSNQPIIKPLITIDDFSKYQFNALQFSTDANVMHVNGLLHNATKATNTKSIDEKFNIKLKHTILTSPHFVGNKSSKHNAIFTQDVDNIVYYISAKGKTLWSKQLKTPMLGEAKAIYTTSSNYQIAFATKNKLHLIEANTGNYAKGFPKEFKTPITQPLAVFDYNNDQNYRLLITQNNTLIMYDKTGKKISGFKHKNKNEITSQPKHFRIASKDYIVFKTLKKINIINRRGANRVNVNTAINFSSNEIYEYKNKLITTNSKGKLVWIDLKTGNVTLKDLKLQDGHKIDALNKILVTLSHNNLTINNKNITLDFATYTAPKIYYTNNTIYVAITNLQNQKILLFDSKGKLLKNFPVYGNSQIDLAASKTKTQFVVKGEDKSIILYQKNN